MQSGDPVWDEVASVGRTRAFRRGERLVIEGYAAGSVMRIQNGSVRIVMTDHHGTEVTLAVRGPGSLIGEHAALLGEGTGAGASVVALTDGEMTAVGVDQYLEILARHPGALLDQARRLVRQLHEAEARLVSLTSIAAPTRIVRLLLTFPEGPDGHIEVPLSQDELSAMSATSRGLVAEVLRDLRRDGLVTTAHRRVVVVDPAGLRTHSHAG